MRDVALDEVEEDEPELTPEMRNKEASRRFKQALDALGFPIDDEHFAETPDRLVRLFREFMVGFDPEPVQRYLSKTFNTKSDEMVTVRNIRAYGMCPHHLMPVLYTVHFSYVPRAQMLGLSKIPRVIKHLSQKPMCQEDLTPEIVTTFHKALKPNGIALIMEGKHMCMTARGVREHESDTVTSKMTGCFADHSKTAKAEFLQFVHGVR